MRKLLSKIIIMAILCTNLSAFADTTSHTFDLILPKSAIPSGGSNPSGGGGGLSSDGVKGIVAGGVVGGLGLLGGLAWFYYGRGYTGGAANTETLSAMCIDSETPKKLYAKGGENDYLIKALEISGIRECPNSRYVLVPDNYVTNKTFNSVFFDIPQDMPNVRVTQVSDPFSGKEFEGRIFTGRNENTELKFHNTILTKESEGIVQKEGKVPIKAASSVSSVLVISYDKATDVVNPMRYAFVIEFYR